MRVDIIRGGFPTKDIGIIDPVQQQKASANISSGISEDVRAEGEELVKINSAANLEKMHNRRNAIAKGIRSADEAIKEIIARMKAVVIEFRKFYPPYPPGSEERVRMIKNFNLLRKQIDQLTIPPVGSDMAAEIQRAQSTPTGLNIPELPESANDDEIYAAAASIETAAVMLERRQEALKSDADSFIAFEMKRHGIPLINETEAGEKGIEVGNEIASYTSVNISASSYLLLSIEG